MLNIGPHLSISKGFKKAAEVAVKINANTFQYFSRNPRGGAKKPLDIKDINDYLSFAKENNFCQLLCHAPYTLNACSQDAKVREFAQKVFEEDLADLEYFPNALYNFHPGSHVGQGVEVGISQITEILNSVIKPEMSTTILLEAMSGKGSEIGRTFEELKQIIDGVTYNEKLGICLDTCHIYSAGYDIVNRLDEVLEEFDRIIGLERLKAIHLNDSMMPYASNKDRHEKIGKGTIGLDAIINIINHPKLKHLPFFLETPNEELDYKLEIDLLRDNYKK